MEKPQLDSPKLLDFQDLMMYRIHEILLVASPYDAYILEEDGRLTEQILHEYLGMNFSYAPRVWQADTAVSALEMLQKQRFDLVIVMMRIADMDPLLFSSKVKEMYPKKPIVLLAFDESEMKDLQNKEVEQYFNRVFIWSGNANVFPVIIKHLEDIRNAKRDIPNGNIRAIIFIEDTPRYYSVILPIIYREIMHHTKNLVSKSLNDTQRLLHLRGRPKILLATSYKEAQTYYRRYRSNVLGIISDIRFPRKGNMDPFAGIRFSEYVRKKEPYMPIMLQSSDIKRKKEATEIHTAFLHKLSDTLLLDIRDFILANFGFGDFIFRSSKGKQITKATHLKTLRNHILTIPEDSLVFHARSNHFSNWLAARGEFDLATMIRPKLVRDFSTVDDLRNFLAKSIEQTLAYRKKSEMAEFSKLLDPHSSDFVRISTGSLGGKARGLSFISKVLQKSDIHSKYPNISIRIPRIAVIGTDDFDHFMDKNKLWDIAFSSFTDKKIEKTFILASLPRQLKRALRTFLSKVKTPLAVRSSGLLEDSQYQPLSGMYATYMLPNSSKDDSIRFQQLCEAIKRIYASVYFMGPKSIMSKTVHRFEDEKMAITLMELIGQKHHNRFYPTLGGTAQNINYYPVSYMKRDEGIATIALGLGRTVAEGKKALRFSPKYPGILPQYFSIRSTIESSQNSFFALNMRTNARPMKHGEAGNLKSYSLSTAESDSTLYWAGSVISKEDDVIRDSLSYPGTRVITFAPLLKWNMFPLADIISDLLELGKTALGCPVEIEFAVNLSRDQSIPAEFCLLQIKPMAASGVESRIESIDISPEQVIAKSSLALGNGTIDNIKHFLVVNPETFDPAKTVEIASEIAEYNHLLGKKNPYVLVGPGRWGSADPWLGVPVNWEQISAAKVIIEVGIDKFPVDPSFGSHFFQNMTSLRVGYFTINHKKKTDSINLDWLRTQSLIKQSYYTSLIELDEPVFININGQTGEGIVLKPLPNENEIMDEDESTGI